MNGLIGVLFRICFAIDVIDIANTAQEEIKLICSNGWAPMTSRTGLITTPPPRPTNAPKKVAIHTTIP